MKIHIFIATPNSNEYDSIRHTKTEQLSNKMSNSIHLCTCLYWVPIYISEMSSLHHFYWNIFCFAKGQKSLVIKL